MSTQGKLAFSYTGKGNHAQDVGAVQSNRPFAVNELIGYFELRITSAGHRGNIVLGMANQDFNVTRHPGKEPSSYGYQGDDGKKCDGDTQGSEAYGPKFGADDVVGCGLHFGTREIFFTKNGQHLGVAFRNISHAYYPTVGLHSEGEAAILNFGAHPFTFPIATLIREEESKFSNSISRLHVEGSALHELVRQYLLHHGHLSTLAFLPAVGMNMKPAPSGSEAVNLDRLCTPENGSSDLNTCQAACQSVRNMIEKSNSLGAIKLLNSVYPSFLQDSKMAQAVLVSQVMIEQLVRGDLIGAVSYAKESLAPILQNDHRESKGADSPFQSDSACSQSKNYAAGDGAEWNRLEYNGQADGARSDSGGAMQCEAEEYVRWDSCDRFGAAHAALMPQFLYRGVIMLLATCRPCQLCKAKLQGSRDASGSAGREAAGRAPRSEHAGRESTAGLSGAYAAPDACDDDAMTDGDAAGPGSLDVPDEYSGR